MARAANFGGRRVTFGESEGADVRARNVQDLGWDGMRAHVATPAGSMELATPLLGRGNLANVLAVAQPGEGVGEELLAVGEGDRQPHRRLRGELAPDQSPAR